MFEVEINKMHTNLLKRMVKLLRTISLWIETGRRLLWLIKGKMRQAPETH